MHAFFSLLGLMNILIIDILITFIIAVVISTIYYFSIMILMVLAGELDRPELHQDFLSCKPQSLYFLKQLTTIVNTCILLTIVILTIVNRIIAITVSIVFTWFFPAI